MASVILSTERLLLRKWLPSDTFPFIQMNKDAEVMKYFPRPLTDEETISLIEKINSHFNKNGFGLFAVEHRSTGAFMGFTGFAIPGFNAFFTPCVEIGWRFAKTFWGQGFATEAAAACLHYGFTTLKFDAVVSFTSVLNIKSIQVMQRIGMVYITGFDHPKIDKADILCPHVLYKTENK